MQDCMDMNLSTLDEVRRILAERPKDYGKIAKEAGLNYYTVRRIATGDTPDPGVLTLSKLAEALGVTA